MLQKLREKSFWMYDKIRGGKVEDHFEDVSFILNNKNRKKSKKKVQCYLSELIYHAITTTDYYSNLSINSGIQDFEVVNKNIIRNNFNKFISREYKEEGLKEVVTSGSTGTPFRILQNKDKVNRNTADTLFFSKMAGYNLGQRLYYFKIWNEVNRKSRWSSFIQNIVPIDVLDQSDTFFLNLVRELNSDKSVKSFLGYASAYEALCKYLDKTDINKVSSKVQAVISMSEALNSYTKQSMEKYFDCEVVSRYSNVENGILAQQKRGKDDKFFLNTASYFFEILEMDNNKKASLGVPGRIVVTDLFNYAMPMIRYDTGDVGIMNYSESGDLVLTKVEGRRMDLIYDTKGDLVSSFIITNNMWKYTGIKQYQFIQESDTSYAFKINPQKSFDREAELIEEFQQYFGNNAEIRVEYVSEIPLLSSGKRKKVVNKMAQNE